ncbi:hypothetical protein BpHYR1_046380 [Brachionus plicatilis]|uniref:Uncharacterized protein n=1 Tax=Brachionus plicatilis TaxID=10195 RepID=A0A3M7PPC5_BRAPC|nr:hypothetical protein BpHYR1_046380 [Brachionus plicatilis]
MHSTQKLMACWENFKKFQELNRTSKEGNEISEYIKFQKIKKNKYLIIFHKEAYSVLKTLTSFIIRY